MLIAILAAGRSTRFGRDKLTADCAGKPLGQWAMEAALGLERPVVWIGQETPPAFLSSHCRFYSNAASSEGLSSSLAKSATIARSEGAASLLVLLADMPLLTTRMLEALVQAGAPAACAYAGGPGVPALFPAAMYQRIAALKGDRGAGLLLRGAADVRLVHIDRSTLLDVDTPDDLVEAEHKLRRGPASGIRSQQL